MSKSSGPRIRARTRTHRCYELSFKGQYRDPSWTLVHGTYHDGFGHAWLEKDGVIYDAVVDRFMPVDQYVEEFGAIPERRYSRKEAAQTALANRQVTYGPWHKSRAKHS